MSSAGTKGFLFCDLRGYTAFVEHHGDQAAAELLATYRALVRAAIAAHAGAEIKTEGDSVYVVFPAASGAVEAGLAIVTAAEQSTKEQPIRVGCPRALAPSGFSGLTAMSRASTTAQARS